MHRVDSQLKTLLICNINTNTAPVSDLYKVEPIVLICHDQHAWPDVIIVRNLEPEKC